MSINIIGIIKKIYEENGNIIQYLRNENKRETNTIEDILISYDFQAGSYIDFVKKNPEYIENYSTNLAALINNLGGGETVMEVGCGEATTLNAVSKKLAVQTNCYGFDISWSRIKMGNDYLKENDNKATLFIADLFKIPLADDSIDIVYTSHSIEPNGGREKEALESLYRVTKKYLVLLEPAFEFATEEGKERMINNGYITKLLDTIKDLGYNLILHKKSDVVANPVNPTGIYIIKKENSENNILHKDIFNCPISNTPLEKFDDHYFASESLISYPIIGGIPCLFSSYAVLTTKHN